MSVKIPSDCTTLVKDGKHKPARFTVYGAYAKVLSNEGMRLLAFAEQAVEAGDAVTTLHEWTFVRDNATFVQENQTRADLIVHGKMSTIVDVSLSTSAIVLANTTKGWVLTQNGNIYKLGAHSGREDPWRQVFH